MIISKNEKMNQILQLANEIVNYKETFARENNKPIFTYINAIGSSILQELMLQLFTGKEVTCADELLIDIGININTFVSTAYSLTYEERLNYPISLKDNLVIPCAWERSRFVNCLSDIGSDENNDFKYIYTEHESVLILPLGITIVEQGNHSILSGVLKREGIIYPSQIYDLTPFYKQQTFSGYSYKNQSNQKIRKVKYFELGVLFEIGRILAEHNINFFDSFRNIDV